MALSLSGDGRVHRLHLKASPDLSRTTEFLVVAATLLDMKAAHLLPRLDGEEEDAVRGGPGGQDLLFGFCNTAPSKKRREDRRAHGCVRLLTADVALRAPPVTLLPELAWLTSPGDLARLAADASPSRRPQIRSPHLLVSGRAGAKRAIVVADKLASAGR